MYKEQKEQQEYQESSEGNEYGCAAYWDKRYKQTDGQRFDWLQDYNSLREVIHRCLEGDRRKWILNIGCGNGIIQDDLYRDGFHNIINNDISEVVIQQMNQAKMQIGLNQMIFQVMDVTKMTYPDQRFDMVLDKSTIDAMLCSDRPAFQTAKMLQQVERVLKNNGIYLIISYAEPKFRMHHLTRPHVSFGITVQKIIKQNMQGEKIDHYIYICRKKQKPVKQPEWLKRFYEKLMKQQSEQNE